MKYQIKTWDTDPYTTFTISGSQLQFMFFRMIKNNPINDNSDNSNEEYKYGDFYLPSNKDPKTGLTVYKFSQGHFSSNTLFSPLKGILNSYAEGYRGSKGIIVKTKLIKIE